MEEPMQQRDLTSIEVAQILGLSSTSVQVYANRGKFPGCYKAGRDWLFRLDGVEEFKRTRRKVGNPRRKKQAPPS